MLIEADSLKKRLSATGNDRILEAIGFSLDYEERNKVIDLIITMLDEEELETVKKLNGKGQSFSCR